MSRTAVPGQAVLPVLEPEMGYCAITNLKPAQEVFVWEFILSGANAQTAYMRAYPGSKETSALANSSRLLKTERVQQRISEVQQQIRTQYGLDAGTVMRLLAMSMGVDRRKFVDAETGRPLRLEELPADAASIVDIEIVIDKFGNRHALPVVPARIKAAETLAKIAGISQEQQRVAAASECQVNFYIPSNGRDQTQDMARLQTLREKAQAFKDAGVFGID